MLIVGFGRIGKSLIKRCLGFDMKINVFDPFIDDKIIKNFGGNKVENLDKGLETCDYLFAHSFNRKNKKFVNLKKLKLWKMQLLLIPQEAA